MHITVLNVGIYHRFIKRRPKLQAVFHMGYTHTCLRRTLIEKPTHGILFPSRFIRRTIENFETSAFNITGFHIFQIAILSNTKKDIYIFPNQAASKQYRNNLNSRRQKVTYFSCFISKRMSRWCLLMRLIEQIATLNKKSEIQSSFITFVFRRNTYANV